MARMNLDQTGIHLLMSEVPKTDLLLPEKIQNSLLLLTFLHDMIEVQVEFSQMKERH